MSKSATTITVVYNIPLNPSPDSFWSQDVLAALKKIQATDLEIIDATLKLPDDVFSFPDEHH